VDDSKGGAMNIDFVITSFLNQFVGKRFFLDEILARLLSGTSIFNAPLLLSVIWFLWFQTAHKETRFRLVAGVVTSVVATLLSRAIQIIVPLHLRPLLTESLHLKWASEIGPPGALNHWSSFPSDHATLCFGLAAAIFWHNRRLGALAFVWMTVICSARVALGFHFPSDILGGAFIGIAAVLLSQKLAPPKFIYPLLDGPVFYGVAFLVSYQVTTFFTDAQTIIQMFMHVV